jgi:hypothetical protein
MGVDRVNTSRTALNLINSESALTGDKRISSMSPISYRMNRDGI